MKKSKILAPALAILCLSTAASVTGTVAWFAANDVVSATGMTVHSSNPASLVIGPTLETGTGIGNLITYNFVDAAESLNPCSMWNGEANDAEGDLSVVTNPQDVDPSTGLAAATKTLTYGVADSSYYKDYVVYLASKGSAIVLGASGALTASVTFGATNVTTSAVSIAFFADNHVDSSVTAPQAGSYKGVVNAAGLDIAFNHNGWDATKTTPDFSLLAGTDTNHTLDASTGDYALRVTMRVFVDGALQNSATTAYVTTNSVNVAPITFSVSFSLDRGE